MTPTQASTFISAWTPIVFFRGNLHMCCWWIFFQIMMKPGMADFVSLGLSQGQRTPVSLSLVDERPNHIDVIIRNLEQDAALKFLNNPPFSGRFWSQAKDTPSDLCQIGPSDSLQSPWGLSWSVTSLKITRLPGWGSLVPWRWSWKPGPTFSPFQGSHWSNAVHKGCGTFGWMCRRWQFHCRLAIWCVFENPFERNRKSQWLVE